MTQILVIIGLAILVGYLTKYQKNKEKAEDAQQRQEERRLERWIAENKPKKPVSITDLPPEEERAKAEAEKRKIEQWFKAHPNPTLKEVQDFTNNLERQNKQSSPQTPKKKSGIWDTWKKSLNPNVETDK
jgi:hypothetical protein